MGGHLGSLPLPGRAVRQAHAHPRLQLQTLARGQVDRRRAPPSSSMCTKPPPNNGVDQNIRYNHLVKSAAMGQRHVDLERRPPSARTPAGWRSSPCNFLFMCAGYYSYRAGFTPTSRASSTSKGTIVIPRKWPEDLDYAGKSVVVVGSGATAMTLVPAMTETGRPRHHAAALAHPMWSRGPTRTSLANRLRKFLPESIAYGITRWKNVTLQAMMYKQTRTKSGEGQELHPRRRPSGTRPGFRRRDPLHPPLQSLGPAPVPGAQQRSLRRHPFRQGLGGPPDEIETVTENGIRLKSGQALKADNHRHRNRPQHGDHGRNGLQRRTARWSISGGPGLKGMMFSDVPNLVSTFGYINALLDPCGPTSPANTSAGWWATWTRSARPR